MQRSIKLQLSTELHLAPQDHHTRVTHAASFSTDNENKEDSVGSIHSVPTVRLQMSNTPLPPQLATFETSEMAELEKAWKKEKSDNSYNESDIIFAEFDYFKNLSNPNHNTLAEYMTKFRLITETNYRFNKCTCGTFCCRNKAREYRNSLSIIEIILDILISPSLFIIFLLLLIIWFIEIIFFYIAIHYTCFVCYKQMLV